jgi:hypothetical protein
MPIPATARPLKLRQGVIDLGTAVESFGFPQQFALDGHAGVGAVLAPLEFQGFPFYSLHSHQFSKGFSGAPAVDQATGLVLGMIAVIASPDEKGRGGGTVLIIPADLIAAICPQTPFGVDPVIEAYAARLAAEMAGAGDDGALVVAQASAPNRAPRIPHRFSPFGETGSAQPHRVTDLLRLCETESCRPLLISGEAGSGKSTCLRAIAAHAWERPADIGFSRPTLPLYLPLRRLAGLDGSNVCELIDRTLGEQVGLLPHPQPISFARILSDPSVPGVLLLDGYDEVDDRDTRRNLRRLVSEMITAHSARFRVILTSRPSPDMLGSEPRPLHYQLLPFDDTDVRAMVDGWLGSDAADSFLEVLEIDGSRELCANPLILTIGLGLTLAGEARLSTTRIGLYHQMAAVWERRWQERGLDRLVGSDVSHWAADLLGTLAFAAVRDPSASRISTAEYILTNHLAAPSFGLLKYMARSHAKKFLEFITSHSDVVT